MKKFLAIIFSLFVSTQLFFAPAYAADPNTLSVDPCGPVTGDRPSNVKDTLCGLSANNAPKLIRNVIIGAIVVAAIISLFFLIFGGIRWILSGGDKGKVEAARGTIIAAIIGLIITLLAYFILSIVLNLFGLNLGQLEIPNLTK